MLVDFNVKGKTIVMTGGTGGIGCVAAKAFAEHGMNVAIVDVVPEEKAKGLAAEVSAYGVKCRYYQCDVRDRKAVRELAEKVNAEFGCVDVMFNNAAYCRIIHLREMTDEHFEETIDVSLKGCFICSQEFGKYMIESGRGGVIISTASTAAIIGLPRGTTHHSAAKAGICGLNRSMAVEWAKYGIRCNVICPGQIRTENLDRLMDDEKNRRDILANIPLQRVGKPEDVAAAVIYLSSDAAAFITGHMLVVDGGATIQ
jgi:3-oxoacyl-[acyl-carrier protein] reductase